eukprot:9488906-Pyramimonas_sp.AAC.2
MASVASVEICESAVFLMANTLSINLALSSLTGFVHRIVGSWRMFFAQFLPVTTLLPQLSLDRCATDLLARSNTSKNPKLQGWQKAFIVYAWA